MQRRDFITLISGAVVAWPLVVRAQQPAMPVIGFLNSASPDVFADLVRAFTQGLAETGYVEGRNVAIDYRWAENHYDRLPELAADLVRRQVAVIVANPPAVLPAKAATSTIPIVFVSALNPVEVGLVASLSRPGGNVTGVSTLNVELLRKRVELLRELLPTATVIAALVNPTSPAAATQLKDVQEVGRNLGLQIQVMHASTESDLDSAFATLPQLRAVGLVIAGDPFFTSRSDRLAALALHHGMPAIFQYRQFAAAGGLMSYGGSFTEANRLAGIYTGRILKGEKPADLPVQQSTKVELIINLKTAKALGLNVPNTLIGRADEVIE
jgi:putative tryptophan/tyrosine transport system substrate-binding protein